MGETGTVALKFWAQFYFEILKSTDVSSLNAFAPSTLKEGEDHLL